MMGCGSDEGNLSYLDLSNAKIVKGGQYLKSGQYNTFIEDDCLPEAVFSGNRSLRYIAMPSSLKKIEWNALVNSYSIQEIVLNEGLIKIEDRAFAFNLVKSCDGSRGSLKKINIPSTVSSIGNSILYGCTNVNILFDNKNKYFSYYNNAIYSKDFNELVLISPSYSGVFTVHEDCSYIYIGGIDLYVPGLIATNVRKIGGGLPYGGALPYYLGLPESRNLAFMTLGYPLELGQYTFYRKENLTSIYLGCSNIPSGAYRGQKFENASNCTLYVPSSSIDTYKADSFWNKMKDIKPIEGTEFEYLKNTADIILSDKRILISDTDIKQLTVSIARKEYQGMQLEWGTMNDKIAAVNQSGLVSGISFGTTTIYVQIKDMPTTRIECVVTVEELDGTPRKNVTISQVGTLEKILGDEIHDITHLTISGPINGVDLGTLRSMMGCNSENKHLVYLDLKNATIVKGGEYMSGKTLNEDNILPTDVFYMTSSLRTLITPLSLKKIQSGAFYWAEALREIILNEGLEEIEYDAFSRGRSLRQLNIPSSVKSLATSFIEECYQLTDFSLDEHNPCFVFDGKAIYTAGYKELVILLPSYYGDYIANDKCTSIRNSALAYGSTTGLIAANVKTIGSSAFWYADKLKYVAFGSALKSIGSGAFSYCSSLENIYLGCTDVPTGEYTDSYWDNIGRCTLYVPQASIDKFKSNSFWSQMKDIKPIEDTEYAYLANLGDGSVKKNIITNMVGTLSSLLGDEIYDITHLTISGPINGADLGTLRSMMGCGDSYNTTGIHQQLEYLDLSNANVVEGGEYTDGKFLMENDILPEYVFYKNQSLQYLNVPKSLKKICRYALGYSEVLEEVVLNEGLESVETYSIYHSPVKRLNIPSTLKSWGFGFLSYCNSLEDLSLSIDNPYYVCDGQAVYSKGYETLIRILPTVSTYEVNSNCKEITSVAFMGTYNLESIVAPYVKNVGQSAFWSNYVVTIGFGASLSSLGETIFNYCNNLSEIYLGCENIPMGGYRNSDWEQIINCTLYVPKSSINAFKADSFWGKMKEIKAIEGTEYEYLKDTVISDIDKVYSEDKNVDRIYTLDGRLVNKMSKGMYIVNGKKVIVK